MSFTSLFLFLTLSRSAMTCADFQKLVHVTYDFKPSKLPASEQNARMGAMDKVWEVAKANAGLKTCLRDALQAKEVDSWFAFDGSLLLVELDPSHESKQIQARNLNAVDLDDVDLRTWITHVAQRAAEGFDMSEAGAHWLDYADASYELPEHSTIAGPPMGALFIYGSMDESDATPALLKIMSEPDHPRYDIVVNVLRNQATKESLQALKLTPERIESRPKPDTTRDEYVKAFQSVITRDDWSPLQALIDKTPDSEKDFVAVLRAEDVPLLRQVRRRIISTASPHAIEYYINFTQILLTLVSK